MKPTLKLLWVAADRQDAEMGIPLLEESFLVEWDLAMDFDSFRDLIARNSYGVIISSCHKPPFSCLEVYDQLQKSGKRIPFVVLGESSQRLLANECLRRGMCDFIFREHLQTLSLSILRLMRQSEMRDLVSAENEHLREENRLLQAKFDILLDLMPGQGFEDAPAKLLKHVSELLGLRAAALFICQRGNWSLRSAHGFSRALPDREDALDNKDGWIDRIFQAGPVVYREPRNEWPWLSEEKDLSCWAGIPLDCKEFRGVLVAGSNNQECFERGQLAHLQAISGNIAPMLRMMRLFEIISRGKAEWEKSLDALEDLITIYDVDGNIRRINYSLQARMGLPYEAIMGKKASEIFQRHSLRLDFFSVQNMAESLPFSREITDAESGETFLARCVPIQDANGHFAGMIQTAKNITQEKKLREQLIQRETLSALGELVAGVAHELNNPLTGVIGYSQLLQGREDLDDSLRQSLELIANEGARAGKIVQSLLTFARQQPSAKVLTSLPQLIEDTLNLFAYEFKHASVKVEKFYDEGFYEIWADPGQLQQVLVNLFGNALHAMEDSGRDSEIKITLRQDAEWLYLHLRDNGRGIPKKNLTKVFDPFFTTKPVGKGTGLGLSISFGIVVGHRGEITVQSEESRWTEFSLRFPLCPDLTPDLVPLGTSFMSELKARKVLVVDGDPIILNLIGQILVYEGHSVDQASNGLAGLEKLKNEPYDVVIIEISLPDLNPEQLFLRLKNEFPQVLSKLLFLTAELIKPEIRLFLERTGVPWLAKPFSIPELARAIVEIAAKQ